MEKIEAEVNVLGVDKVQEIFKLLASRSDEIPADITAKVKEIVDCKQFEMDHDYFYNMGYVGMVVVADGKAIDGAISINEPLKRIKTYQEGTYIYFNECKVFCKDKLVIAIGE